MPTNANTFNSRVTSEALEAKFRQVFPAQGGAELVQDLYASGVIQPIIDFSSIAEGSVLPTFLQTAWDFATGYTQVNNATQTIINNTGFWKIDLVIGSEVSTSPREAKLYITDGLTNKVVYEYNQPASPSTSYAFQNNEMFVFLRAGDSLIGFTNNTGVSMDVVYRQVADVNGNLVNPLGFTFS